MWKEAESSASYGRMSRRPVRRSAKRGGGNRKGGQPLGHLSVLVESTVYGQGPTVNDTFLPLLQYDRRSLSDGGWSGLG
jgi:hypothetical protein